jgi:2'-5' RNA ligase
MAAMSTAIPPPPDPRPLILTARLDAAAASRFEALRRAHFPPERNQVPAHVTLFHQLPGSMADAVVSHLKSLARAQPVMAAQVLPPRSLGNGVAFDLRCPPLVALHAALATHWTGLTIAQDNGRVRPHVTVQNKVSASLAAATLAQLGSGFVPWQAQITGVTLWRYLGGPWQQIREIGFRGRAGGLANRPDCG